MGINVGAFLAPVVAEIVQRNWGFHPAFAVAGGGMAISVLSSGSSSASSRRRSARTASALGSVDSAAVTVDAPPTAASRQEAGNLGRRETMDAVPNGIGSAPVCRFLIVMFFGWCFTERLHPDYWAKTTRLAGLGNCLSRHQRGMGIILTFPLGGFSGAGSTAKGSSLQPTKMAFGMMLTGLSFFILFIAARWERRR